MDMEPTYFLFSGKLFHASALERTSEGRARIGEDQEPKQPPSSRGEDPGPEGPEGEPVGEEDRLEPRARPERPSASQGDEHDDFEERDVDSDLLEQRHG